MTTNELELWQKIENFQFDKPDIKLTFAKRLARENNFANVFAEQIIEEYRKFIFLCCTSNQQITPSHYVDLAWHLHLTYTKSYWVDLCQNTICREIHHNPTEGGKAENVKFRNYYNETLALYKTKFLENPPINIWQNDQDRFKNKISNIDTDKHWIIKKPVLPKFDHYPLLFVFSLLLVGCNQVDKTAFPIVLLFVIFGAAIYMIYSQISNNNKTDGSSAGCGGGGAEGYYLHSSDANDSDGGDGGDSDGGGYGGDGGGGDGGCSGCGGCGGD